MKEADLNEATTAKENTHQMIAMLMRGVIAYVEDAKSELEKEKSEEFVDYTNNAIDIIKALQNSLDTEFGGGIAVNLDSAYSYMIGRLVESMRQVEPALMDDVIDLMAGIHESWIAIPKNLRSASKEEVLEWAAAEQ